MSNWCDPAATADLHLRVQRYDAEIARAMTVIRRTPYTWPQVRLVRDLPARRVGDGPRRSRFGDLT